MMILHTATFYICWLPFAIRSILTIARSAAPLAVTMVAILCAKGGIVVHPMIYIWFNKQVNIFSIMIHDVGAGDNIYPGFV